MQTHMTVPCYLVCDAVYVIRYVTRIKWHLRAGHDSNSLLSSQLTGMLSVVKKSKK